MSIWICRKCHTKSMIKEIHEYYTLSKDKVTIQCPMCGKERYVTIPGGEDPMEYLRKDEQENLVYHTESYAPYNHPDRITAMEIAWAKAQERHNKR